LEEGRSLSATQSPCRFEEAERGVIVVSPRPELNDVQWADIEEIGDGIVSRVRDKSRPRVVIDLTEMNYMGSAMVALLVRVWKAVDENGGKLAVCNVNHLVREVLDLAGLTQKWTVTDTREEAVSAVSSGGGGAATGTAMLPTVGAIVCVGIAILGLVGVLGHVALGTVVSIALVGLGGIAGIAFGVLACSSGSGLGKLVGCTAATAAALILIGGLVLLAMGDQPDDLEDIEVIDDVIEAVEPDDADGGADIDSEAGIEDEAADTADVGTDYELDDPGIDPAGGVFLEEEDEQEPAIAEP